MDVWLTNIKGMFGSTAVWMDEQNPSVAGLDWFGLFVAPQLGSGERICWEVRLQFGVCRMTWVTGKSKHREMVITCKALQPDLLSWITAIEKIKLTSPYGGWTVGDSIHPLLPLLTASSEDNALDFLIWQLV